MKILLTGSGSGLGQKLYQLLTHLGHDVEGITREILNLSDISQVISYKTGYVDMLINCAGTGIGGKIDFCQHNPANVIDILNTNFIAPVILCQSCLKINAKCKIVNVTSTNNNRYWPKDLAYSLSKKSLEHLGSMLRVEYPDIKYLEVRLGLTKTNFNKNRYRLEPNRFEDLYQQHAYLTVDHAAQKILEVLFDESIKIIEISP